MDKLPSYEELPEAPLGGKSAWGLFGPDDNVGLVNRLTPERVAAAARLVKRGAMFPLDEPLDAFSPAPAFGRSPPRHTVIHHPGTLSFDDVYDNLFPQGASQWDSLGHVAYQLDSYYNGATENDVANGRRNTIDHWTRHGIATRAVVLDVFGALSEAGRPYDPWTSTAFSVDDLELARQRANLEIAAGDVILLHTGWGSWYKEQSEATRRAVPRHLIGPGIERSEDMCAYLWDSHAIAIASDAVAVEVWPADMDPAASPFSFLHRILIGQFGMALGELWSLSDLVEDCKADGIYEAFFVSVPLHARGAIGSPANALAIK